MRICATFAFLMSAVRQPAANAQVPLPVVPTDGLCRAIDNTYDCAQAVEAHQLDRSGGRASRLRGVLRLRLDNGRLFTIRDDTTRFGPTEYSFLGHLPKPDYFVLHAQFVEGNAIRLVNARTGWSVFVDDLPVPSPDATRLVTASLALEAAFNPNRLAVWIVDADTIKREWALEPQEWGPAEPQWLTALSFRVIRMHVARQPPYPTVPLDTVEVVRRGAAWGLGFGR